MDITISEHFIFRLHIELLTIIPITVTFEFAPVEEGSTAKGDSNTE